jgi:Phosphotransferase enzyme family
MGRAHCLARLRTTATTAGHSAFQPHVTTDPPPDTVARVLALAAPSEEFVGWRLEPDAYPARTPSTERLERLLAQTRDGRTVSVFVKTIRSLRHWPTIAMLPEPMRGETIARFPWRVEAETYASDILDALPSGLRAPTVFSVEDLGDDRVRIWMEDVAAPEAAWDEATYTRAARLLGRLAGRSMREGFPDGSPRLFPGLRFIFEGRTLAVDLPALRNDETWRHPVMVRVARADPDLRADLLGLGEEAPELMTMLESLPRSLAHGDACPQNLLPDPGEPRGLVAIDWGFVGLEPVGYDLGQLLVGRFENGDLGVSDLAPLSDLIEDGYVAGLGDEGWTGDRQDVRRGFLGGLLLRSAFSALPLDRLRGPVDDATVELFASRARYARFLLELGRSRADAAAE